MNPFSIFLHIVIAATLFSSVAAGEPAVKEIAVPNGGVHPQVCVDERHRAHVIYFKGDPSHGDIFYVRTDDGGATFTKPIRVNSEPDSAMIIGTVRGPRISVGKDDRVHVAWMGSDVAKRAAKSAHAPLLYTRLNDTNDAFEPQQDLIGKHPGLDGGGTVAADRAGNVYVVWHAPAREGVEGEGDRQVFVARSRDDGKTFDAETSALTEHTGVCGCCGIEAFATADRVFIWYRSATEKVHRDSHIVVSRDAGKTFTPAIVDLFNSPKCVMSTAGFAQRDGNVFAAWETNGAIRFAALTLAAPAPNTNTVDGTTLAKHPSIAMDVTSGRMIIAWAQGAGWNKGGQLMWQTIGDSPRAEVKHAGAELPAWSRPAAFVAPDGSFRILR